MLLKRILLLTLCLCCTLMAKTQVNTDHMMMVGRNALYFKDYVLSIQYFNQVVNAKPYLYEPYFYRGLAKFYLDDFTGAETDCSIAVQHNPFVPDCYQVRGLARVNMGKYREAVSDYRQALKYEPTNEGLWHNLALCYANLKSYDEAIGVLDTLRNVAPSYTDALNMRAQVHIQREDTLAALVDLEASLAINRFDSDVYGIRALLYMQQERYEEAEKDLTYAIHLSQKGGYYINRALTRYYMQDFRGAMADYDLALDIEPNNLLGHYNRGLLRAQVGDNNRAIEDFDFVITHEPDNTFALFNRALLLMQTGDWQKAELDLSTVIDEYPKFMYGYQCRADVRRKLGRNREAEEDELIVLKAQIEEQNRLLVGGAADEKEEEASEDEATRKASDKNINKYKRLVVSDEAMGETQFASAYRGKVQNRNIYVALQPLFVLTYYRKGDDVSRAIHYHRYVEQINRRRQLPAELLITSAEQPLDEEQIAFHFKDIDEQTARFADDEGTAIYRFARGLDFYLVQDLDEAVDDYTQSLVEDGGLWIAYFNRAVAMYKQIELERAVVNTDLSVEEQQAGSASIRLSEFQVILSDINKAIDLAPDFAYSYYNRGNILSHLKDYRAAIVSYDEAIRLDASLAEAYYNRGLTYIYIGENQKGIADLSKAGELGLYGAYNLIKRFSE